MSSAKSRVVVSVVIAIFAGAAYLLGWSSFLSVKSIHIIDAPSAAAQQEVAGISGLQVGEKLARIESRVIQSNLLKIEWVDHSSIQRNWFNGSVDIRLWPRTPIATYQKKFIDAQGHIFTLPNATSSTLPAITAKAPAGVAVAISLLTTMPPDLLGQIRSIDVGSLTSATVLIQDSTLHRQIKVLWGDASEMALKIRVYQSLITLPENKKISLIDLVAPHAPIVK